jgi:threonine synthase
LTKMGVQIAEFRVATNQNDVLHRLFDNGEYALSDVLPSLAPSMDIQVASNFERLLYFVLGKDTEKVRQVMSEFRDQGKYCFEKFDVPGFSSSTATDSEIPFLIKKVLNEHDYLIDPHTACGFKELGSEQTNVVLATAHPAKFPSVYEKAGMDVPKSEVLDSLYSVSPRKFEIDVDSDSIQSFILENI